MITVKTEELVSHALDRMRQYNISQIPVIDNSGLVGSVDESDLFRGYFVDKNIADKPIKEVMRAPFPIVSKDASVEEVSKLIHKENEAVLVDLGNGGFHIITKHDVINVIN